jgi:hypothetical protein
MADVQSTPVIQELTPGACSRFDRGAGVKLFKVRGTVRSTSRLLYMAPERAGTRVNERQLTTLLLGALQEGFDIQREVKGYNQLTRGPIRAGIVAHPKPHLVAAGFVDVHFCIGAPAHDEIWTYVNSSDPIA